MTEQDEEELEALCDIMCPEPEEEYDEYMEEVKMGHKCYTCIYFSDSNNGEPTGYCGRTNALVMYCGTCDNYNDSYDEEPIEYDECDYGEEFIEYPMDEE